jgi:hypothetical protein
MLCFIEMRYADPMTAEECNDRALTCAANAELAVSELVARDFMKLAAQWRAMAGRVIFLDSLDEPAAALGAPGAIALPPC